MKPPVTADLLWDHELVFNGTSDQASIVVDSAGVAGPSPVQALVFALAGCMGMDLVHILKKGRYDLQGLRIHLSCARAQDNPHRITAADLRFQIAGAVPGAQVQRAIDLSREKYCSVWHSLAQDIVLTTTFAVTSTAVP